MKKIVVFGTGIVAKAYLDTYPDIERNTVGYLESGQGGDRPDYRKTFKSKPLYNLSEIMNVVFDEIHIANSHFETVKQLIDIGVKKEQIVLCYIGLVKKYMEEYGKIDVKFNLPSVLTSKFFHSNLFGDEVISLNGNQIILNDDYCRRGTLQLLINEVKERNICGELAELGVYQGEFSKYLNLAFPDRYLYLFDTFEGFSHQQKEENIEKGFSTIHDIISSDFTDTSIQVVMDKMKNPEKIVICKGLFPESIPDEEIDFAMVSLDCDLYSPILEGLRYFYPRLSPGGYIMIHDYNSDKFGTGIKEAIKVYEAEMNIRLPKVPLPDEEGTLVITK